MRNARAGMLAAALCCAGVPGIAAEPEEGQAASTLSVYQSLAADAIAELCSQLHPPESLRVEIAVEPPGTYWFIEEAMSRALRSRKIQPVPEDGEWRIECAVKDAHVQYAHPRREGILGAHVLDRTASLALWMRVSARATSRYLIDQEWQAQQTDTINVSDVDRVEHPGVAATHAIVPPEGFFSSWLEPLIFVGAIGVAIFLLFTTRS
jgi:hypothetical protein